MVKVCSCEQDQASLSLMISLLKLKNGHLPLKQIPARLVHVNNRLDTIYSLIQKHRVGDLDGLIQRKEEIRGLINSIVSSDERLSEIESLLKKESDKLKILSEEISEKRKSVLPEIELKVTDLLKQLGIPNAKFKISLIRLKDYSGIRYGSG